MIIDFTAVTKRPEPWPKSNDFGHLHYRKKTGDNACNPYERAWAICEQVLGSQHPDTAVSLSNLGGLLQGQGDLAGAKPYFERALHIFHLRLGQEHPFTQTVQANLEALETVD